jgi:predicted nucleic acid-binding protein
VKWLLDTNVISETIKSRPSDSVIFWIARQLPDDMAVSIITLAEIQGGIRSATDSSRRDQLMRWLETNIEPKFADRALPLTSEVLIDWLRLSRALAAERIVRRAADLLLASTARVHGLTVVTRNVRHFANTGVVVYDPWSGKTHVMETPDAR